MKVPVFHPPGETVTCDILDGPHPADRCGILELSAAGAKLELSESLAPLTYVDCRLRLTSGVLPLFACVLGWRKGILRLRWLHVDRGELDLLQERLTQTMQDDWAVGETRLTLPRERKTGSKEETASPPPEPVAPVDPAVAQLLGEVLGDSEVDPGLLTGLQQVLGRVLQANQAEADGDPLDQRHVELLERKIARLASSLNDAESLIGRLQAEVAAGPRTTGGSVLTGAPADDAGHEAKQALLKALVQENRDIRRSLNDAG